MDSEFGQGNRAHALAIVVTTLECCALCALAASLSRPYPDAVAERLLSACTLMLVYTWIVLMVETALAVGRAPPLSPHSRFFVTTRVISLSKKLVNQRRPPASPPTMTILVQESQSPPATAAGESDGDGARGGHGNDRKPSTVLPVETWGGAPEGE